MKVQRIITLLSSDAEWVVTFGCFQGGDVHDSIIEKNKNFNSKRVENNEPMFIAGNIAATMSSKHVDIRYKYVNKYVQDRIVKIIFVKSAEKDSDILTKNLGREFHAEHESKIIGEKPNQFSRFGSIQK